MKSSYIIAAVALIALGIGGVWFLTMSSKSQTPEPAVSQQMPAQDSNAEKIVVNSTDSATQNNVKEFTIEGSTFKFVPNEIKVKKGDAVKITFKNVQGFHDFVIKDLNITTKQIQSPGEETVEFVASMTGTFEFICSVGEHAKKGMKGNLIVE